jgi:F-type H+-transporting ATPase subunit b
MNHVRSALARGAPAAFVVLVPAVGRAASEGGLQILPDPRRLFMLMLLFFVLWPLMSRLLFRPLLDVFDEREKRIEGARSRARQLAQDAESLLTRHAAAVREAREAAAEERRGKVDEARGAHQRAIGEARQAAEVQIAEARREVADAAQAARSDLRTEADGLAREVAERLLGRSVA